MDNYPEDIRQYDNDPRSPFYDDGGREAWEEERASELWSDCMSELELDPDVMFECITSALTITPKETKLPLQDRVAIMRYQLFSAVSDVIESAIEKQLETEWDNRD